MKIITYIVDLDKENRKKKKRINVEKLLLSISLTLFCMLILVQFALTNSYIRSYLFTFDDLEGVSLGVEEVFYKEGEIHLLYDGNKNTKAPIILVNGEEKEQFHDGSVVLNVIEGDIIEIDGCNYLGNGFVEVTYKSNNIIGDLQGKKFKVPYNVMKIIKIKIE